MSAIVAMVAHDRRRKPASRLPMLPAHVGGAEIVALPSARRLGWPYCRGTLVRVEGFPQPMRFNGLVTPAVGEALARLGRPSDGGAVYARISRVMLWHEDAAG